METASQEEMKELEDRMKKVQDYTILRRYSSKLGDNSYLYYGY